MNKGGFQIAAALVVMDLLWMLEGRAQGTFRNLDFENGTLVSAPGQNMVDAAVALPGWTVMLNNTPSPTIRYNDITLDLWSVSIHDSQSHFFQPISGMFSVRIWGGVGIPGGVGPAAIAQTGQIPTDSRSLLFKAENLSDLLVSVNGNELPFSTIQITPNYTLYGADIREFAGQLGELRFTAPGVGSYALIDDIQFSTINVPEPSAFSLLFAGGLILWGIVRKTACITDSST